jgi:transketolase
MIKSIPVKVADNIRILSAAMVEKAQSGHPGGAMGGADFITILFTEFLRFDPGEMNWPLRDRFFLDPGHMSPMLYSVLTLMGIYTIEELKQFRQWRSPTPGHPELDVSRGIENTSGPLGQGHAMAVGAALAERFLSARFGDWFEHKIYTFISDGGIQEEISQGAGRIAGYLGLYNLIMFYDANDVQLSTYTDAVTLEDTAKKYEAWGWNVMTIDGNDMEQIRNALRLAGTEKKRPTLIIGKTVMGKGAMTPEGKSFEKQYETHGQPLSKAGVSVEKTIINLGGNPDDPFGIFPEVKEYCEKVRETKTKEAEARKKIQSQWVTQNPYLAGKLSRFLSRQMPEIDFESIELKPDMATRMASGKVLDRLGQVVENMIVISADLANSDKTDGFLQHTKAFKTHDFSGNFLHAGVSELTMTAIANGISLHGGVFVACGTFFVFSDYMKPALRLAALMGIPVIYIWTHDSFRVGEDGPTHQPVEHEAQIRLMEHMKNHAGENSMLVLRPADSNETLVAWRMALRNATTPTALILSRQSVKDLPSPPDHRRFNSALEAQKGAYCILRARAKPDIVLVASGSEVSTLFEAAKLLIQENGLDVQVVSVPSEGLFRKQDLSYQNQVIPRDTPIFGLTAGLTVTLRGLTGDKGTVMGLDHFGYSAPAAVLDEKFGYNAQYVRNEIISYLAKNKS